MPLPDNAELESLVQGLGDEEKARALTALAESAEPAEQERILQALVAAPSAAVMSWVIRHAQAEGPEPLRSMSIRVLVAMGEGAAIRSLVTLLGRGSAGARAMALEALSEIGGRQVAGAAIHLLGSRDHAEQAAAERLASAVLDETTLPNLLRAAGSNQNDRQGSAAARVLGRHGGPEAEAWGATYALHHRARLRRRAAMVLRGGTREETERTLWGLTEDADATVRNLALDSLQARGQSLRRWALAHATDADPTWRHQATHRLRPYQDDEVDQTLLWLSLDSETQVRTAALDALPGRPRASYERFGLDHVSSANPRERTTACRALALAGDPAHAQSVAACLEDSEATVREEALRTLNELDAALGAQRAATRLAPDTESSPEIRALAARLLAANFRGDESTRAALLSAAVEPEAAVRSAATLALASFDHPAATALLLLSELDPHLSHPSPANQACSAEPVTAAVQRIEAAGIELSGLDRSRFQPGDASLCQLLGDPEARPAVLAWADRLAEDSQWVARQSAARVLAFVPGVAVVERLLSLAQDSDDDVRVAALDSLARHDDRRGANQVILSLYDPDPKVATRAEELLCQGEALAALAPLALAKGQGFWRTAQKQIDELLVWAASTGYSFLGQPVDVFLSLQGIGQTTYARARQDRPQIEINPEPLLASEKYGTDVVKGVLLHELGHHAFDFREAGFKSARGAATAAGARNIFDLLIDERLERRLRSVNPSWGRLIDRMNAYLIETAPQVVDLEELARAMEIGVVTASLRIRRGELPGELVTHTETGRAGVRLRPIELVQLPGVLPPYHSFFLALMAVRDPERIADEAARRALEAVPADFKDAPHGEVARLAMYIAEILGCHDDGAKYRSQVASWRQRRPGLAGLCGALSARMAGRLGGRADFMGQARGRLGSAARLSNFIPRPTRARLADAALRRLARQRPSDPRRKSAGGRFHNLSADLSFPPLEKFERLLFAADEHVRLQKAVRPHTRRLRPYFERLGVHMHEEYQSRRGRRIDLAAARFAPLINRPNLLVHGYEENASSAYVGLLIDRSGSMSGQKIETAKRFGMLLAESTRGIRGVSGHVDGFDDDTFYELGNLQHHTIASLTSGGSNNDCGALYLAAQRALRSRRRHRLLIMISDGSPTECSQDALCELVKSLTRYQDIRCAQVAVAPLDAVAFPSYLDVSGLEMSEATLHFGRLLTRLTQDWTL